MTQHSSPTLGTTRALWYVDRGLAVLHEERLPDTINSDHVVVRSLYSAISRGTERLVFLGAVPETEYARMRAPMQTGDFPFPVKYGYCTVGVVEIGPPELRGHVTFCLHPHQERFVVKEKFVHLVPSTITPKRAVLAANLETALNAHWDAGTRPGDRITVVGAGVVGLLTAYLARRMPGCDVTIVDVSDRRKALAEALGLSFTKPNEIPPDADVVFHTSATGPGLQSAIDAAGHEATVVEMSWYGAKEIAVGLGGAFHSKRLRLVSSQVGQVAAANRSRWDFSRRLAKAISLLDDPALDILVERELPFDDVERRIAGVFADNASDLPPVLSYDTPALDVGGS